MLLNNFIYPLIYILGYRSDNHGSSFEEVRSTVCDSKDAPLWPAVNFNPSTPANELGYHLLPAQPNIQPTVSPPRNLIQDDNVFQDENIVANVKLEIINKINGQRQTYCLAQIIPESKFKNLTSIILPQSNRPLAQSNRPLAQSNRPLAQSNRPLVQSNRPLAQSNRPLAQSDHSVHFLSNKYRKISVISILNDIKYQLPLTSESKLSVDANFFISSTQSSNIQQWLRPIINKPITPIINDRNIVSADLPFKTGSSSTDPFFDCRLIDLDQLGDNNQKQLDFWPFSYHSNSLTADENANFIDVSPDRIHSNVEKLLTEINNSAANEKSNEIIGSPHYQTIVNQLVSENKLISDENHRLVDSDRRQLDQIIDSIQEPH